MVQNYTYHSPFPTLASILVFRFCIINENLERVKPERERRLVNVTVCHPRAHLWHRTARRLDKAPLGLGAPMWGEQVPWWEIGRVG